MLYYIAKPLAQFWFKVQYRKIFFTNAHSVPHDRPLIFAVNHPTAFMEPALMGAYLPHIVHFMLRGDVFSGGIATKALKSLKTIPIFRARDGFRSLKSNQATFDLCYELLSEKKHIVIMAEGVCRHEKRMRPIQKGTARMAFGAYEKYGRKDIAIVPVGINFTNPNKFRSEIMIDLGPLIKIEDYVDLYDENPRKAINAVTEEISKRMFERIVHIENRADDEFVERLLTLNRNFKQESVLPAMVRGHNWLWEEKYIADQVNVMPEEEKQNLIQKTNAYFSRLKQLKISDVSVAQPRYYNWVNTLVLILGFIPFLIGAILNYLPVGLSKWVADTKIKSEQFKGSVRFGVGMGSYFIYWLIFFVTALITSNLYVIIAVFLMPALGYFALQYYDFYQLWKDAKKFDGIEKSVKKELSNNRKTITELIPIPKGIGQVERA